MIYLLAIPLLIGLTLVLFIADHNARHATDLHWLAKLLLLPWLHFGFALDVSFNLIIASIAFLELPHEITFSARIKRHIHESAGWRFRLATWVCKGFLRPIDEHHCH